MEKKIFTTTGNMGRAHIILLPENGLIIVVQQPPKKKGTALPGGE